MTRALVLAAGPGGAESAVRWVSGDALVHIGEPSRLAAAPSADGFDDVIISGDLADHQWVSQAFEVADRLLGAGRRVTLVMHGGQSGGGSVDTDGVHVEPLPNDVIARWRLVGVSIEDPITAAAFSRAAEVDHTADTARSYLHAHVVGELYRNPLLLATVDVTAPAVVEAAGRVGADDDAEVVALRRELAAYRTSAIGRTIAWCRRAKRRLRRTA